MDEYILTKFSSCPRCESKAYDRLSTHSYCADCSYSPDLEPDLFTPAIPNWALEAIRSKKMDLEETDDEGNDLVAEASAFPIEEGQVA